MSDTRYYLTLLGWLLICAAGCVWAWLQVRNADRKKEAEEARQIEADYEWDLWVSQLPQRDTEPSKVVGLPKGKERGFQARSRRAESLGFKDDEPPKRSA